VRGLVAILVGLAIGIGAILLIRRRARRRRADELIQHPERLDQMLDKTDDA
jgi:Flp pilus assembly protein TadB